jgi:hypothetical protein
MQTPDRPTARDLRQYADGELPPLEARRVAEAVEADPRLREAVDFEQRLRSRVRSVMEAEAQTPPWLSGAIRRRLAAVEAGPAAASSPPRRGASIAAWLRGPRKARPLAVAASLAIVAGAVLLGIFGRPIDEWRKQPIDLVDVGAPFVASEHERCAGSADARSTKATFRDALQAEERLGSWVGGRVPAESIVASLSRVGWGFFGAGYCEVPVSNHAGHLMFIQSDPAPAMLSVFVVPDQNRFTVRTREGSRPLPPHQWIRVVPGRNTSREVSIYSDGVVVYIMAACYAAALDDAERALESAIFTANGRRDRGSDDP